MLGRFLSDWKEYGLAVAWWNLRFEVGYKIGGFTDATRARR